MLFAALCLAAHGQEKTDRYAVGLGYSRVYVPDFGFHRGNLGELKIEGNYAVNNFLGGGVYMGYTVSKQHTGWRVSENIIVTDGHENCGVFLYGVNVNFHLLPLFVPASRFDVYLTAKLGGYHIAEVKKNGITANFGMGVSYRLFRHAGLFAEYGYGIGEGKYRDFKYEYYPELNLVDTDVRRHISSFRFGVLFRF